MLCCIYECKLYAIQLKSKCCAVFHEYKLNNMQKLLLSSNHMMDMQLKTWSCSITMLYAVQMKSTGCMNIRSICKSQCRAAILFLLWCHLETERRGWGSLHVRGVRNIHLLFALHRCMMNNVRRNTVLLKPQRVDTFQHS